MADKARVVMPPRIELDRWLGAAEKAYEDFLAGYAPPAWLPQWVAELWNQSRQRGVNPYGGRGTVLSEADVKSRLRALQLASALDKLWEGLEGVAGGERMVELADGDGYVLLRRGNNSSKVYRLVKNFGYVVGARMSMGDMGLTGVGGALESGKAIQVPGPYHWRRNQHGVSCTAAPVLDPRRKNHPFIVINITDLGAIVHPDTLRLVRVVAGNVHRELAIAHCNSVQQLCEGVESLERVTGWALVTDWDGWVAASHRLSAPPDRVTFLESRLLHPGRCRLPELGRCVLEPLPGGWLVGPEVRDEDNPIIYVALDLRHPKRWWMTVTGPNVSWHHELSRRHAEILLLLAATGPIGRTGPQLSEDLYGTPKTPVRPLVCRLREYAGGLLDSRPYRFSNGIRVEIKRPVTSAELLPETTAPGVIRMRQSGISLLA